MMGFNRPEAKYRAKLAMRGAYPHPMLVTLVYVLLTSVLTGIIMYFVTNPFSWAYWYLLDGADIQDIYRYIFTPERVSIYLVINLIVTLYLWVMRFGYAAYALGLARRTGPGYRTLLEGFTHLGKALLVSFLVALFASLWGMLATLPGIVVTTVGGAAESYGLVYLGVLMIFAGAMVEFMVTYRYRLAVYFLLDDPDMGTLAAITASKRAMQGHKGELFAMDLSFLGWQILSAFTLGILGLWVSPYYCTTDANFYQWVVYGAFPEAPVSGGYQSPYQNGTGPQF